MVKIGHDSAIVQLHMTGKADTKLLEALMTIPRGRGHGCQDRTIIFLSDVK